VPFSHALYQGEELLASDLYLSPIAPISVNEAGDDFALLMPEGTAGSIFLVLTFSVVEGRTHRRSRNQQVV
jgi:hypothetical protein